MTLMLSKNHWAITFFEIFQSGRTILTCDSHCRSPCMNPKRQGAQTRLQTAVSARVRLGREADHFCIYVSDIYRNPNRLLYCCNLALSPGKYICTGTALQLRYSYSFKCRLAASRWYIWIWTLILLCCSLWVELLLLLLLRESSVLQTRPVLTFTYIYFKTNLKFPTYMYIF